MELNERGFSNLMAIGFLLLAVCCLFIYHGIQGTDRGDVSQPIVTTTPAAAAAPRPTPQATQQPSEPTPEPAAPEPTVDAALYANLESAIAEGRNMVVNSSYRARRLLGRYPLPMTEWVEFIRRLSEDVEGYTGRLSQVRRGVAIDDPAYPTLEALQAMLGAMDRIVASADPHAYSALEPQFAEAVRHLDVAWEALQAPR